MADNVTKITIDGGSFAEGGHLDAKVLADLERYLTAFERAVNGATTQAERFSNMLKKQGVGGDFSKSFYVDSRATDKVLTALQAMQEKLNGATENRRFKFSSEEMDLYTATRTYKTRRSQNLAKEDLAYYGGKMTATGNPNKFTIAIPIEKGSLDTGDFASNVLKRADNAHIADLKYEQQKKEIAKQEREAEKKQLEDDKKREYAEKLHQKKGGILDYNKETGEYTLNGKPIEYPEEKDARKQKDGFFKTTGKALTKAGAVIGGIAGSLFLLTNITRRILGGVGRLAENSRQAVNSSNLYQTSMSEYSKFLQVANAMGKGGGQKLEMLLNGVGSALHIEPSLINKDVINGLALALGEGSKEIIERSIYQGNRGDRMAMASFVYDTMMSKIMRGETLTRKGLNPKVALEEMSTQLEKHSMGWLVPMLQMGFIAANRKDVNNKFQGKHTLMDLLSTLPTMSQDANYVHNSANYNIAKTQLDETFKRVLENLANKILPWLTSTIEKLNNFLIKWFGSVEEKDALKSKNVEINTQKLKEAQANEKILSEQASNARRAAGLSAIKNNKGKEVYATPNDIEYAMQLYSTNYLDLQGKFLEKNWNSRKKLTPNNLPMIEYIHKALQSEAGKQYLMLQLYRVPNSRYIADLEDAIKKEGSVVGTPTFSKSNAQDMVKRFGGSTGGQQMLGLMTSEGNRLLYDDAYVMEQLKKDFKGLNSVGLNSRTVSDPIQDGGTNSTVKISIDFTNKDTGESHTKDYYVNLQQGLDTKESIVLKSRGGNN